MTEYYHLFPVMCMIFPLIIMLFRLYNVLTKDSFLIFLSFGLSLFIFYCFTLNFIISVLSALIVFEAVYWIRFFLKRKKLDSKEEFAVAVADFQNCEGTVLYKGVNQKAVCIDRSKKILTGQIVSIAFDNGHTLFIIK